MPKHRIVLSYDVQKIFEVNAKDEDTAMDKARDWKGDLESDDWEYRDLIESKEIDLLRDRLTIEQLQHDKVSVGHKKLVGDLYKQIDEVKEDNKKLSKQVEDHFRPY